MGQISQSKLESRVSLSKRYRDIWDLGRASSFITGFCVKVTSSPFCKNTPVQHPDLMNDIPVESSVVITNTGVMSDTGVFLLQQRVNYSAQLKHFVTQTLHFGLLPMSLVYMCGNIQELMTLLNIGKNG